MNKAQHSEAKRIFFSVIGLTTREVDSGIASATNDPAIRSLVRELYDAYQSNTQHTRDYVEDIAENISKSPGLFPTERYLLIKKLGHGGMGSVYLAQRKLKEINNKVAIKILHPGEQIPRDEFLREAKILSQLAHKNVSQFIDADFLEDGRPYVVMEYAQGQPLTTYCWDRRLNLKAIMALFKDLCAAVIHAHRNLIVHLDIKPENILVTQDGTLKLLDFGIARIIRDTDVNKPTNSTALTPAYASPEQLLGLNTDITSDVYSLGVVLYELLTGCRPPQPELSSGPEHAQSFTDTRLLKPSQALKHQRSTSKAGAQKSPINVIPDDLDAIILKAMEVSVDARYQTVNELLADLECLEGNKPVSARSANVFYVSDKFVQRHSRWIAGCLIIGMIVMYIYLQDKRVSDLSTAISQQNEEVKQIDEQLKWQQEHNQFLYTKDHIRRFPDPFNSGKTSTIINHSVNIGSGQLFYAEPLRLDSQTIDFRLYYNSSYARATRDDNWGYRPRFFANKHLGKGWSHNFTRSIITDKRRYHREIGAFRPDGGFVVFTDQNNEWNNQYSDARLTVLKEGALGKGYYGEIYQIREHDETEYYDLFEHLKKLVINGVEVVPEYSHENPEAKLRSINSDDGSSLQLSYLPKSLIIKQITENDSGQVWTMSYDPQRNLSGIVYPDNSKKRFQYRDHLLTAVFTEDAEDQIQSSLQYQYDPFGRVYHITFSRPDCGEQMLLIEYHNDQSRIVTNDEGQKNTYQVEQRNGQWLVVDSDVHFNYLQDTCER